MTEPTPLLSSGTSAKINWSKILDQTAGLRVRSGGASAAVMESSELEKYRERVPQVFAHIKEEFAHVSANLRSQLMIFRILQAGLMVLIIGSAVLAAVKASLWGTVVNGGGLAALFAIFVQNSKLSQDQMMLALLPKKYELALQLATSPEHFKQLLDRFLEETKPLRDK
jgi:hypothetical protein